MAAARTRIIRLAQAADAQATAEMSRDTIEAGLPWRYQPAAMLRFIESRRHNVIVADVDGVIAGFAVMGYGDDNAYLALLAVAPAHRRAGIARQLLLWLLKTAEVAGVAGINVELREDNTIARQLYESLGFDETGHRPGGYYGVVNQTAMRLQLRPPAI